MNSDAIIKFYDTHAQGRHLDECEQFYIYQRENGLPHYFLESLIKARNYYISLKYWNAGNFSAAYIAANKEKNEINICISNELKYIDYKYEVTCIDYEINLKVISVRGIVDKPGLMFEGTLDEFDGYIKEEDG